MASFQDKYQHSNHYPQISERSNTLLKVREMLESVRHRVSSVTSNYGSNSNLSDLNRSIAHPNDSIDSGSLNFSRRSSMRSDVIPNDSISSSILIQIQSIQLKLNSLASSVNEFKREADKEAEVNGDKVSQAFLVDQLKSLHELENNVDFLKLETIKNLNETRKSLTERLRHDSFYLHDSFQSVNSRLSLTSDKSRSPYKFEAPSRDRTTTISLRRSNTFNPKLRARQARHSIGGLHMTTYPDDTQGNLNRVPEESHDRRIKQLTKTSRNCN